MPSKGNEGEKMVKKNNKKKAGIIAGSIVAAGIVAGGATIGIIAGTAKVTVNYETGVDGITFKSEPIKKGGNANLPTPMRPGYKFLGWYLDADGNVPATSSTKFNKDTTLYAQWKANEYSVVLKDEELNTDIATSTFKAAYSDRNLNTLNLPILENVYSADRNTVLYTFKGWKDETGNIVASVDQSFNGTTIPFGVKLYGATLYADWEGAPVDVYFGDELLGTKYLGDTIALKQGADSNFYNWTVNASSRDAEFWKTAGAPGAAIKLTRDLITLNGSKIEIKFSIVEGTASEPEYNVLGEPYTATQDLELVTREGYTFGGWYLNSEYTTRVVKTEDEAHELGLEAGSYVVGIPQGRGRVVLYAKMLAKNVTIKYDYGNAELKEGATSTPSDTFKAGERILLPAHARNYVGFNVDFVGWEYNGTRQTIGEAFVVPTNVSEITLKAVWGSAYNLLNFNLQGGSLASGEEISYNYNELKTYPMPNVTVSKLGYEFAGWSLSPNTLPSDEANIIKANGEYTVTAQTTLYAIWKAKQYEIDYNLNNGNWVGEENRTSALFGNEISLANTPTRAGYTFVRWDVTYYNASGSSYLVPIADKGVLNINSSAIESNSATTINVAAVWEANSYFFVINNLESENDAQYVKIEDASGNIYEYNHSGVTIPYDSKITIDVANITARTHYSKVIGAYLDDGSALINDDTGAYTADKMYAKDEVKNEISFTFAEFDATTPGSTVNYKINREADRVKVLYTWEGGSKEEEQTTYYDIASTATGDSAEVLNLKDYLAVTGAVDTKNSAGNYFYYWVVTDATGKDYYFDGAGVPIAGKTYNENLFNGTQTINNLIGENDTITVKAYYGAPIYATVNYVDYNGTTVATLKYDVTAVNGRLEKTIYVDTRANADEKDGKAMPISSRDGYTFDGWSLNPYNVVDDDGTWVIDSNYKKGESLKIINTTNLESDLERTVYAYYIANSYKVYVVDEQDNSEWYLGDNNKITVQPNDVRIDERYSLSKNTILAFNGAIKTTTTIDDVNYDLIGFTYIAGQPLGSASTNSDVIIYGTNGTPALVEKSGEKVLYIYIVWAQQQYKYIEYNANNGIGTSTIAQMYNMEDDPLAIGTTQYLYGYNTQLSSVTVNKADFVKAPTRVGYTFAGWVNEDGVEVESITFTKYVSEDDSDRVYKLFAKWQANKYNVVYYDENKDIYSTLANELSFDGNYTLTQTLSADKSGNDFIGWAYGIDVNSEVNVITPQSLEALDYLINGGKVKIDATLLAKLLTDAGATEATWNRNVNFYPIFATPMERYVKFTGLTTDDGENAFGVTENLITFKSGIYGGVVKYGTTARISIADIISDLNENKRKNTAYRVDSISYTDVNGIEHNNVKDGYINLTWGNEAPVVTLNWVEDQVNLTFDLNDGSGRSVTIRSVINSSELIENRLNAAADSTDVSAALNPAHSEGVDENGQAYYTFLGWATLPNATNAQWFANVTGESNKYTQTSKEDTTLYAVWKENFVTIEFNSGNDAVVGTLPTTLRIVKNAAVSASSAREAITPLVNEYKLWEDDSNFNLANFNFGGWKYTIENRSTTGVVNVGETLSSSLLGSLITGGIKNNHLILTANWKQCLTDGTNGTTDYFTADGKIDWVKVEADGITEISLPKTIHGDDNVLTALSASTLTINNNSVTAVYLPKTIASIDAGAIVSSNLTNVVIPSSVGRISAGAIVTSNLTSLTIPNKAVVLNGNPVRAYAGSTTHKLASYNLKTYETDTAKTKAESDYTNKLVQGCILNTAGSRLIAVPQQYESTTFNFEEIGLTNVNAIASYAFSGVNRLTSLTLSDAITSVSTRAIGNMPRLTTLSLSTSTPLNQTELFDKGVTNLTNISGGNYNGIYAGSDGNLYNGNVKNIVKYSAGTMKLTLDTSLTIGEYALDGMNHLNDLTLGAGTEKFANQVSQISRTVNTLNTSWETLDSSIYALSNPTSLTVHSSIIPEGVYEGAKSLYNLTLGDEVTTVPAYAFRNANNLHSLSLGKNITTIGKSAFEGTGLNINISMPASLQTIENRAFANTQIGNINFKEGSQLASLGEECFANTSKLSSANFSNCTNLSGISNQAFKVSGISSISFPSSLTTIGTEAFAMCTNLSYLSTSGNEQTIGEHAFDNVSLQRVELKGIPTAYAGVITQSAIVEEITFNYNNPTFDQISNITAFANPTSIKFSDAVTQINNGAFTSAVMSNLTNITLGKNVTLVAGGSFSKCTNLTNIYSPSLAAYLNIDFESSNNLFVHAQNLYINNVLLTELVVPYNITEIKAHAFEGYNKLTNVTFGSGVKKISSYAFYECENLSTLNIPSNVTEISDEAFAFSGIVNLTLNEGLKTIGIDAFLSCEQLAGDLIMPNSVTKIGSNAFDGCILLTHLTTGGSETDVGEDVFYGVTLQSITLKSSPSVYNGAITQSQAISSITFDYNNPSYNDISSISALTNPTSVIFTDNVTSLPSEAFSAGFANVTNLTLGNGITGVPTGAFSSSSKLKTLTLGTGLTAVGSSAFSTSCDGINIYAPSLENWLNINFSVNPISSPNSSLYINNELLTELVVPSGITEIKSGAFRNYQKLTSVDTGNSVATVGGYAFYGCSNIKTLRLGENVTNASSYPFENCTGLTAVYVPTITQWLNIKFAAGGPSGNPLYYAKNLYVNNELLTNLVVPSDITTIDYFRFYNCESLISVSMASSVTTIRNWAFDSCANLATVTIGSGVKTISDSAFARCTKLKTLITGGSETSVYSNAFTDVELTNITLNAEPTAYKNSLNQTTAIEDITYNYASPRIKTSESAFNSNMATCLQSPTTISFGANVTTIPDYAFYGLTSITDMTITNNITSIGTSAFQGCSNITGSLNLPRELTTLGENAFRNCAGFTGTVTIPSGVSTINNRTFAGCTGLTRVNIPSSVTTIVAPDYGGSPFFGCSSTLELYCDVTSKPSGWGEFWNLYEMPGYKYLTVHWKTTDTRVSIAEYAARFIGNPYLYGGTSLTNGCDVSGFTMSVYKSFGISLPHTVAGQMQMGTAVAVQNYNVGDLVFWDNNTKVGIYEGVGYVIACIPNEGVKRVQVSSFTTVRSFF